MSYAVPALHLPVNACGQMHIVEGSLVCPNCDRKYAISEGIPNMLLHEDEV